jgi:hypothetical protein
MKKVNIIILISILSVACFSTAQGQLRFNVNINLQPQWGPASYDYAEYYFLPELGIYYSVPDQMFIYPNGHRWLFSEELPPRYRRFNLYSTYKVVVNEPKPYLRHQYYVEHYHDYYNRHQDNRRDFNGDNGRHRGWAKNGKNRNYDNDFDRGYNEHDEHRGNGHGHGHGRD